MNKLIVAITALFVSVSSAFAQKVEWSVGLDAGVNLLYDSGKVGGAGFVSQVGADAFVLPQLGFRAAVQLGVGNPIPGDEKWKLGRGHFAGGVSLDVLWDVIRTFNKTYSGLYSVQPYVRIGSLLGAGNQEMAFSMNYGAGVRQKVAVSKGLYLSLDMNAVVASEMSWRNVDGHIAFGQVRAGVIKTF